MKRLILLVLGALALTGAANAAPAPSQAAASEARLFLTAVKQPQWRVLHVQVRGTQAEALVEKGTSRTFAVIFEVAVGQRWVVIGSEPVTTAAPVKPVQTGPSA